MSWALPSAPGAPRPFRLLWQAEEGSPWLSRSFEEEGFLLSQLPFYRKMLYEVIPTHFKQLCIK